MFEKIFNKVSSEEEQYIMEQDGGVDYTQIVESEEIEDNGITIED